jgi:Tol biopolymer transport system component
MLGALLVLAAASAPAVWAPANITSPQFESHAAFDPLTGDLYFVRSTPQFTGWRILVSRCQPSGWTAPVDAPFAGDGVEADPVFTDGGRTMWFISTRSTDGVHREDLDIWMVRRRTDGVWDTPERLPEPVNSAGNEWFPRWGPDNRLYFGSSRPGGLGRNDIWRARQEADGRWTVENAGPELNSPGDEYEPLISPDGRRMLLATGDGYFESRYENGRWTARVRLGPEINANGSEIGAVFSPGGGGFLFSRALGPGRSGEFLIAGAPEPGWPPACPRGG